MIEKLIWVWIIFEVIKGFICAFSLDYEGTANSIAAIFMGYLILEIRKTAKE